MLLTVEHFVHKIGNTTIKPIQSKIAATHKIPALTQKLK